MNVANYKAAKSYCYKLHPVLYNDLLHDVYLYWWSKGKDLFEEPNRRMIHVIRNYYKTYYRSNLFMWRGQMYPRRFVSVVQDGVEGFVPMTVLTPFEVYEAKELNKKIRKNLDSEQNRIYTMLKCGKTTADIAKTLRYAYANTNFKINQTRKKIQQLL